VAETAVIIVDDLLFQSRIRSVLEALGFEARVADTPEAVTTACAGARIAVVDLHAAGLDALAQVRAAKEAGAAVLAYGRHTEPKLLRSARDAGADIVVPRSELVSELPQLVERLSAGAPQARRGAL
jgi:DNA-binding NarL/FixJ family response regulator